MKHEKQCWVATKCFPYQHKNNCIYDQIIHFEIFTETLMSVKSDKKKIHIHQKSSFRNNQLRILIFLTSELITNISKIISNNCLWNWHSTFAFQTFILPLVFHFKSW